jgi:hypothetical protein
MVNAEVLQRICTFLIENPDELVRVARNAKGLKFGLPLAALRWVATEASLRGFPAAIEVEAAPPGLQIKADVELKGTPVRVRAQVSIIDLRIMPGEFRVELRVTGVALELLDDSVSPISMLIKSGALDLSKIGNLIAVLPKRPAFLVEAQGDRIVLDFMRHPVFGRPLVEALLTAITPLITVTGVASDSDHIDLKFGVLRQGLSGAVAHWRSLFEALKQR